MTDAAQFVCDVLNEAGIRAIPAWPAAPAFTPTAPVAAVSIERLDTAGQTTLVLVRLLSPGGGGGRLWEQTAVRATQALADSGAVCVQDKCDYDGQTDLFTGRITARYPGLPYNGTWNRSPAVLFVDINSTPATWITQVTAREVRDIDPEDIAGTAHAAPLWKIEMVRQPPAGTPDPGYPNPCTLRVTRGGVGQQYPGCYWTQISHQSTPEGEKYVYSGFSRSRSQIS